MIVEYTIYFKSELRGLEEVCNGCTGSLELMMESLQYYKDHEPTEIEGQYILVINGGGKQ